MKVKCEFCGNYIDDADEKCPHCGAANSSIKRTGIGVPKTIEELKQWYIDHDLPDENTTRFFIGKDYSGPRAFGIYKKDSGDFVVYKNKNDGTRVTRYVGSDEEYAVSEIYLKLKEEIVNQKSHKATTRSVYNDLNASDYENRRSSYYIPNNYTNGNDIRIVVIITIVIFVLVFIKIFFGQTVPKYHRDGYSNSSYSSSYYDDDYSSSSSSSSSSYWSSDDWDSDWDSSDSWDSDWSDWDSDW